MVSLTNADPDTNNIRTLTRENEAADILARQGYAVEQMYEILRVKYKEK